MDSTTLILAVMLGVIGMAYLSFGKIRKRVIPMVGGVVLMLLPYWNASVVAGALAVLVIALLSYFMAY